MSEHDSIVDVATVADLSAKHIGWLIRVAEKDSFVGYREFRLDAIRAWTYRGRTTVGLVDPSDAHGYITGTEHHYRPDVACELLQPPAQKKNRKAA